MAAVDGTIRIDTKVDPKGFNDGTKKMSASLGNVMDAVKKIGVAIGLAFSGAFIANFVKGAIDKFDLMGSRFGTMVNDLQYAFYQLQGAVANVALEILALFAPYIIAALNWLTRLLNVLAQLIVSLFGVGAALGDVGDKMKYVGKTGSGALAAFDKLNVLNSKESLPGLSLDPKLLAQVDEFKKKMLDFLKPVTDALGRLFEALLPLGMDIWQALKWAWDNILVPLGTWVMTQALPAFLDLLGAGARVLHEALVALQPAAQWLWDNFLKPLATFAGDMIILFLKWLTERLNDLAAWIKANPQAFLTLVAVLAIVAVAIWALITVLGVLMIIVGTVGSAVAALGGILAALPIAIVVGVILLLIGALILLWLAWDMVANHSQETWDLITRLWGAFYNWVFLNISLPVMEVLARLWGQIQAGFQAVWLSIGNGLKTAFTGVYGFVKGIINNIIGLLENMLGGIVTSLNILIAGANAVGSITPGWTNIASLAPVKIPRLATGAVIPPNSEFVATLGDNKRQNELLAPEDTIRRIVREESGGLGGDITVTIPVLLDGEKIFENQKKIQRRRGNSLLAGGSVS